MLSGTATLLVTSAVPLAWARCAEQHGSGDLVYSRSGSLAGREPTAIIQPLPRSISQQTWGINYSFNSRSSSGSALSILIKNFLVMGNPCLPLLINCSPGSSPRC